MSLETALELLATDSTFAAIEYLNSQDSPTAALEQYNELLRHLHWQEKDLFGVLAIGRAGITFGLEAAKDSTTENKTQLTEFEQKTRSLAYNLASYTWPGWAEAGIEPGASDMAAGLEAAGLTLRLVQELQEGALPLARANWLVGAHLLAAGESASAVDSFDTSARHAREAGEMGEALLAEGFSALSALQRSPGSADPLARLADVRLQLKDQEHGDDFIAQIDTAAGVFGLGG